MQVFKSRVFVVVIDIPYRVLKTQVLFYPRDVVAEDEKIWTPCIPGDNVQRPCIVGELQRPMNSFSAVFGDIVTPPDMNGNRFRVSDAFFCFNTFCRQRGSDPELPGDILRDSAEVFFALPVSFDPGIFSAMEQFRIEIEVGFPVFLSGRVFNI